jgi:hypothetical protein
VAAARAALAKTSHSVPKLHLCEAHIVAPMGAGQGSSGSSLQ